MNTPEWEGLRTFRQQVYTLFGWRRDALFDTLDAALSAPMIETQAHLSLAPNCHRRWGSLYDAQSVGTMDRARLERLVASHPLEPQTGWFAVDASVWPRSYGRYVAAMKLPIIPTLGSLNLTKLTAQHLEQLKLKEE